MIGWTTDSIGGYENGIHISRVDWIAEGDHPDMEQFPAAGAPSAVDLSVCMAAPVDYVNDIARVSSIDRFISVNGAVDIDLFGQASSI